MQTCKFETAKGFLDKSELQIQTLSAGLERKDAEIASLRGVVTEMSDRLTRVEMLLLERMDGLEALVSQLQESSTESNLAIDDVAEEIGRMQEQLGIAPGYGTSLSHRHSCNPPARKQEEAAACLCRLY